MVVEVVFDAFDDLVVLVPFAGDEYHITLAGKGAGGLDGGGTVFDDERVAQFVLGETCRHVLQNGCGFLVAGVVGGQYECRCSIP